MATVLQPKRPKRKASVLKRIRQTERRTAVNRTNRSRMRTQIKKFRTTIEAGQLDQAEKLFNPTMSLIDKMIQKGVIRHNTADRYKSRLSRAYYSALKKSS